MRPLGEAGHARVLLGQSDLRAVLVGIIESSMARLRLIRVPQLLAAASVLSAVALMVLFRRSGG